MDVKFYLKNKRSVFIYTGALVIFIVIAAVLWKGAKNDDEPAAVNAAVREADKQAADSGNKNSLPDDAAGAPEKPGIVINPKADRDGNVSWDAVPGAAWYKVGKEAGGETSYSDRITGTSYRLNNVPDEDFKVFVVAFAADGRKTVGIPVRVTDMESAGGVELSDDNGTVSWEETEDAVKYQVAKVSDGRTYYGKKTEGTSYTFRNAPGKGDHIYIIAFDEDNNFSYSEAYEVK